MTHQIRCGSPSLGAKEALQGRMLAEVEAERRQAREQKAQWETEHQQRVADFEKLQKVCLAARVVDDHGEVGRY